MSLALYRTYRPGRFADVVGQEHVTGPLSRALTNDRVHHAYLFSGPRGCGKTSSARILARSLNCAQGPTAEPCGVCRSCVDLAPNGPGSMDVIELDAATHGLVDDARDLREKAHFSPVSSPFKVYIIDEAHQLGPGAANALLKIIEEPPPHLKFVFATTAPDKLLGTIRSRTHHYPFRLVPSRTLQQHLAWVGEQEGVVIEPAALTLVARAAAGSVRDALSILGQLIAGSAEDGVTYALANALLGFTPAALLDEVVDAVAASDGATVFGALDRVMETGHDPRRFLTDLLERFRDLLVLQSVPDAAEHGLIDAPDDEVAAMVGQAGRLGAADLVRLADVVDAGITAMKGATPTRLQLELVCARLLLPGADHSTEGVNARLDRMERRLAIPGGGEPGPEAASPARAGPTPAREATAPAPAREATAPAPAGEATQPQPQPVATEPSGAASSGSQRAETAQEPAPAVDDARGPDSTTDDVPAEPVVADETEPAPLSAPAPRVADLRRQWPDILERLKERRKFTWILISEHAQVVGLDADRVQLAFDGPGPRSNFTASGHDELVRQAIIDQLGIDLRVEAVVDPSAQPGGASPGGGAGSSGGASQDGGASADGGTSGAAGATTAGGGTAAGGTAASDPASRPGSTPAHQHDVEVPADDPVAVDARRAGARGGSGRGGSRRGTAGAGTQPEGAPPNGSGRAPTTGRAATAQRSTGQRGTSTDSRGTSTDSRPTSADDARADAAHTDHASTDDPHAGLPHPDDEVLDDSRLSHLELLERTLGAKVISEVEHDR